MVTPLGDGVSFIQTPSTEQEPIQSPHTEQEAERIRMTIRVLEGELAELENTHIVSSREIFYRQIVFRKSRDPKYTDFAIPWDKTRYILIPKELSNNVSDEEHQVHPQFIQNLERYFKKTRELESLKEQLLVSHE